MRQFVWLFLFGIFPLISFAQTDTSQSAIGERLKRIENELKLNPVLKKNYEDLTFYYSQLMKNQFDSLRFTGFKLSAYIDAYYAHYSDQLPVGEYQKFPTSAPISNAIGLNLGIEYKPMVNTFLRFEGRYLHLKNNENIFFSNGINTNVRTELVTSMGVWF